MTAQILSSSTVDGSAQGWSLNPQEPAHNEAESIVAGINRAIVETCVPSNGKLEMTPAGGWTYDMPWHRFPGGKLSNFSPLCGTCRGLFDYVNNSQWTREFEGCDWATQPDLHGFSHIREGALLQLEQTSKCDFCRLSFRSLSQNELNFLRRGFKVQVRGEPESSLLRITWDYFTRQENASPIRKFSKNVMLVSKEVDVFPPSFISRNMNSRTSWSLARLWLEHCVNNHEECGVLGSPETKLPTRLIDLGQDKEIVKPRICKSAMLSSSTKYMTLSHRWGTGEVFSLTTETIEHWAVKIPLSDLPLTFKHAMEATKELGCRYLWIDSLCIIQDSHEDWEREAAMMGDVYQNSYCNLAAAAPNASSNTGLYNTRDIVDVQMPLINIPNAPLPTQGRDSVGDWFCFDEAIWQDNVVQSPLFKRGWVVQERILSPRILHFAGNQMFWECLERRACETLPAYIPAVHAEKKLSTHTISVAPGPLVPSPFGPSDESLKKLILWESIVERYSSTELTFPEKDKLIALSGIAKKTGIQGEYLAGMWKEALILHLLWHRKDDSILRRPALYQAPTWSWASVNGQVQTDDVWPMGDSRVTAEIIDENIDLVGRDSTGSIRSGWLKIRAPLTTITVGNVAAIGPRGQNVLDWNETQESPTIWAHIDTGFDEGVKEAKYHALMITLNRKGTGTWGYGASGLLLEPTGNRGQFHRRGLWSFQTYDTEGEAGFQNFWTLFNQAIDSVDRDAHDYECVNDDLPAVLPRYGICIF